MSVVDFTLKIIPLGRSVLGPTTQISTDGVPDVEEPKAQLFHDPMLHWDIDPIIKLSWTQVSILLPDHPFLREKCPGCETFCA